MTSAFMDPVHSFAFYIAINALIMLVLAVLVVRARVKTRTDIGDGSMAEMAAPLRAHANNTEYVPMALMLIWAIVPLGGSIWLIHGAGATLTVGRILHGIGLSRSVGPTTLRFIGIILTWISFIIGIVGCLWLVFVPNLVAGA